MNSLPIMKNLYVMNDSFCMKSKKADICLTQEKLGSAVNKELATVVVMGLNPGGLGPVPFYRAQARNFKEGA